MEEDSRELVARAVRGEGKAIETLLERHLAGLRGFVERRAGRDVLGAESASDLVQSVCREVLERLAAERFEYRDEAQFRSWLYNAALYKIQNRRRFWRAGKRDRRLEQDAPSCAEPWLARSTPSREAARREELARVEQALAALPERYRSVIQLARVEGKSHTEVAAALGISEGASRMLLVRALARLATLSVEPPEG